VRHIGVTGRAAAPGLAATLLVLMTLAVAQAAPPVYAPVVAGRMLEFPADHGSHPEFRTEWWYVTGWLETAAGEALGFQVTFFRTRPQVDDANPSAFSPRELVIAHAAVSDPKRGRLWHEQRIARSALGLAGAERGRADVWLDHWRLRGEGSRWATTVAGETLTLSLEFAETQAALLNGEGGVSRKGPAISSASWHYSLPHLRVSGSVSLGGERARSVTGSAWLDHEWSSEYLDAQATGWDWVGLNLDDGGALMAFRIRGRDGSARWAGGTLRAADGSMRTFAPDELRFEPGKSWQSPRTGTTYPIEWRVVTGDRTFELRPLMADQENDARLSTGAVYWEGAVTALENGARIGRGYLELTGYGEPLRLP
jgi:predicted secreted hydrolase